MDDTVLFLGAGFSKASGLRTTAEVERDFLTLGPTPATRDIHLQEYISSHLGRFWRDVFGWKKTKAGTTPSLEDHFTLVDLAANTGHNLGHYTPKQLRAIRRISIHRVFDILDEGYTPSPAAFELLGQVASGSGNAVITTNWDTAAERYVLEHARPYWYGFDAHYVNGGALGRRGLPILKLHGSSNWMYCDTCRRIYTGQPGGGKAALHSWTFLRPSDFRQLDPSYDEGWFASQRQPFLCKYCGVELSARVATFSFTKALGFFQFQAVWDKALACLRQAKTWVFIGYSLPQADFEIRALLKTAELSDAVERQRTIVAVPGRNPEAHKSFAKFFGSKAKVYKVYLDEWWRRQTIV